MAGVPSIVQHNITAMNSYRNYKANGTALSKALEKLSSGYRINRAGDDAAGLAISEKMRAQITGLSVAQKNANDGISLVQTAEGALTEVHSMLNRMYELAEQSANGTYESEVDRAQLQKEVDQLRTEINRIADSADFNGIKLLDGSLSYTAASTKVDSAFSWNATTSSEISGLIGGNKPNSIAKQADPNEVNADTLGVETITHKAALNAEIPAFTVELNNYAVTGATDLKIDVGGTLLHPGVADADVTGSTATLNVSDNDLANTANGYLDGAAIVDKIMDAYGDENKVTIDGVNYTVTGEGNKLNFVATKAVDAVVRKDVTITADVIASSFDDRFATETDSAVKAADETLTVGENLNASDVVSFKISSDLNNEQIAAVLGKDLEDPTAGGGWEDYEIGVEITQKYATAALKDFKAVAGKSISSGVTEKVTYAATVDGRTITFEKDVTGSSGTGTNIAAGDAAADDSSTDKVYYNKNSGYDADDTVKISLKKLDGYVVKYANGTGETKTVSADVNLTVGTASTAIAAENGKVTVGIYSTDTDVVKAVYGSDTDKTEVLVGEYTIDLNKIETLDKTDDDAVAEYNTGSAADVTDDKAADTFKHTETFTATAKQAGGGSYNVSTGKITEGASELGAQLASTKLDAANFRDQIKDGSVLQIGGQNYIFAVGSDSKIKDDGESIIVDLTDKTIASGDNGLKGADVDVALHRLTDAARGNEMFFVGYQEGAASATGKLTLTENKDYYGDGEGKVLLNTKEKIQEQIKWGDAKQTSTDIEAKGQTLTLQIGDTSADYNKLKVNLGDMHAASLGIGDIDISSQESAAAALDTIKNAINSVSDVRGTLGAMQNRLEHTIANLGAMQENLQSAESVIRDTDVASTMMDYVKMNILNQSAQAMLAQANQLPQGVLQLLS